MAIIELDDSLLNWTGFTWQFMRQQSLVQTAGLRNNFYTNGAARLMVNAQLWSDTPQELQYLHGTILPAFYAGDNLQFTPPPTIISYRGSETDQIEVAAGVGAGSNQFQVRRADDTPFTGLLQSGTWFTLDGHTQIYVINNFSGGNVVTFAPNLRIAAPTNTAINYQNPKLTMEFLPDSLTINSNSANQNFTTISFSMAEVL